jgi:hypothetical protein
MSTERWRLSPLEFDTLWDALRLGEPPYPLDITSHGETEEERRDLCGRALDELARRLEFGTDWAETGLACALRLLACPQHWVDSVWVAERGGRELFRLLAAGERGCAVMAVQLPGDDADHPGDLLLSAINGAVLVDEVIAALPAERPGSEPTASAPTAAFADRRRHGDEEEGFSFLRSAGEGNDREARTVATVRRLLDADHFRAGQIAANTRDRVGRRFRSPVLFWFDNSNDGRYLASVRPDRPGEDRVTVGAADYADLVTGLRQALAELTNRA